MTINSPSHIRAARALLDWTREQLAQKTGLSPVTIANLESGKTESPNPRTYEAIEKVFLDSGVVFTAKGVEQEQTWIREVSGENFFLDILDDIYTTMLEKGGEVLSTGVDDRLNTPEISQRLKKLSDAGIKNRDIIEENNTYILGPISHYKWIPKDFFKNYVKKIYGDKIFLDFGGRGILIRHDKLADVERNQFNLIWKLLPRLNIESTAHERI